MALLTDSYKGRFAATTAPGNSSGHSLRLAYRKSAAGGDTVDLRVQLRSANDATLIAEWLLSGIGDTYTATTLALTGPQAAAITSADYTGGLIYVLQREGDSTATSSNNRSADVSWLEFYFAVETVLTPPSTTIALTTAAPTLLVTNNVTLTPPGTALTLTTGTPTLAVTEHITLTPLGTVLTLTTGMPSLAVSGSIVFTPPGTTLTVSTGTPTLAVSEHITLEGAGTTLGITTAAPTLSVTQNVYFAAPGTRLEIATAAPALSVTEHIYLKPPGTAISLSTAAPTFVISGDFVLTPPGTALALATGTPTLAITNNVTLQASGSVLTLSTAAPTLTVSQSVTLRPGSTTLTITTGTPSLILTGLVLPPALDLTGDYVAEHTVTGDYVALFTIGGDGLNQEIPGEGEKWYAGDSKIIRIVTTRNLADALEVTFRIVKTGSMVAEKTLNSGITLEPNAIIVRFDPQDTAGKHGTYNYECELTDAAGNVGTEAQGRLILLENYI